MTYYYYNSHPNSLSFSLSKDNYYRFGRENSTGRFCLEFFMFSGVGRHVVGFSNSDKNRTFIAYYHQGGNTVLYCRDPTQSMSPTSLNIGINAVGMVCIDTYISKITVIKGEESDSRNCSTILDDGQWFAYLDYDASSSLSCDVSINFGEDPFSNQMPDGYSPWISRFFEGNCIAKNSYITSTSYNLFILTYLNLMIP